MWHYQEYVVRFICETSIGIFRRRNQLSGNCDNVGAIYQANNAKISNWTKHVDTRIHFVRNYIEDNTIKITFLKSEDNLFNHHTDKFMSQDFN